ncbi:hypothetical protein [Methylomonas koyamae]|uniref:hypothetical protein n=1 Tax=Methylomonas koyamae TaxID=702114 RepID=UPI00278C4E49|nr:hypothetical protein [Methylomonas koyamae]
MEIRKGEKTVAVLENIAIGRNGAGEKSHRGDDVTPLGNYRIGWINDKSAFRKFFGLTYPNVEHADHALKQGKIDLDTYELSPGPTPMGKYRRKIPTWADKSAFMVWAAAVCPSTDP